MIPAHPIRELNRTHPRYDVLLELLCTLPPSPWVGTVADLAVDLGITPWRVHSCVRELSEMGVHIRTAPVPVAGGEPGARTTGYSLEADTWPESRRLAEDYYDALYAAA